jgi:hypothetical protein
MLAGAAFSRSDLSPLTGVTVLRFIPGYGLQRYVLGRPPPDAGGETGAGPRDTGAEPAPVRPAPLQILTYDLAGKPIQARVREALGQVVNLTNPQANRFYVFVATGDRQIGFNFAHLGPSGWSPAGLTWESSLIRAQARAGLGWQAGPYTAWLDVMQCKTCFFAPWLPSLTDNRIEVSLIRKDD